MDKITLEDARYWLEILEANLLDADYRVYSDSETHFKIAAVRRLIDRNEELEAALQVVNNFKDGLNKAIGKVL